MRSGDRFILSFLLCLAAALLAGCSAFQAEPATTAVPEQDEPVVPVVSATGVVVPARWSTLSLMTQGVIEDLAASEDQAVQPGDVLVRLQGQESLQAAAAGAHFELFSAEQALDDLYDDLDVRIAEATEAVVTSERAVRDARQYLDNLNASSSEGDINQARANLILAQEKLERAEKDFRPYENKREDNLVRAGLLSVLAQAQKDYEQAVRRLNNLEGKPGELTLREAESDLALAEARLAAAQHELDTLKTGPDPDEVRAAEERIANARQQLAAAEAALQDQELRAPFAGTVSELYVRANEWIGPGQPVLLLADLNQLRVETTDLNEIDVARLEPGDRVTVTFDALPDVVASGEVTRIATKAATGSGVNYKVVIELDEIPAGLRWGMTAFVDVQVDE